MPASGKPLLLLPERILEARQQARPRPPNIHYPDPKRQVDRLGPSFEVLERTHRELQATPVGGVIEKVLVFETVGSIDDFVKAATALGFTWIGERIRDDIRADEDFYEIKKPEKALSGRVYMVFSQHKGMKTLLSLWKRFKADPHRPDFKRKYAAKWRDLFWQLQDIHPWGPKDRLRDTGLEEEWEARVGIGAENMHVEVELWYHGTKGARREAQRAVIAAINAEGGRLVADADIEAIGYHALLAHLPIQVVDRICAHRGVHLVQSDNVMFLRPAGQVVSPRAEDDGRLPLTGVDELPQPEEGEPVLALLDGLPLENHRLLQGQLRVDDPDGWAATYPARAREHGTAMASLILHGELDAREQPLRRPLYVRAILRPSQDGAEERVPDEVLAVNLLHQAVQRMFEAGVEPPAAPDVRVINLSVGDKARPFYLYPSPWARLVDYLSYQYKVLFIVSAGNHSDSIEIDVLRQNFAALQNDPSRTEQAVLAALRSQRRNRRILSPAEAVNALTIGAVHEDASVAPPLPNGGMIDPFVAHGLPSPLTPIGSGFGRAIKPEILLPGGRQLYREKPGSSHAYATLQCINSSVRPPGQKVAAPGPKPGDVGYSRYRRGTSNAAALATRAAGHIHDMLIDLRMALGADGERLRDDCLAVLIKALLVHGALWGPAADALRRHFEWKSHTGDARKETEDLSQWLGYGQADVARVLRCTDQRVTLLACDHIMNDCTHRYRLPLPSSLAGRKCWRRLIVTLAWFTGIHPQHQDYQRGDVWFQPQGDAFQSLQVKRQGPDRHVVRRGTVQHEIFEGESASAFADNAEVRIDVVCRELAGNPDRLPYGLAVTLEVAAAEALPLYEQVSERIRIQPVASV